MGSSSAPTALPSQSPSSSAPTTSPSASPTTSPTRSPAKEEEEDLSGLSSAFESVGLSNSDGSVSGTGIVILAAIVLSVVAIVVMIRRRQSASHDVRQISSPGSDYSDDTDDCHDDMPPENTPDRFTKSKPMGRQHFEVPPSRRSLTYDDSRVNEIDEITEV